ncbi:T-cell-specific guanine nucleotide triphosphate-binding protein 1-like [Dendronephthya gigantea]|uniref:T-cell-specific guanine nucleotide triphosphate-binding protein 1-like n=1 Tax=Dendronephthya gigantea TaxID=151771 RepID=UPI001069B09E|nr:T-cell-specific guanine nucleotide triphosphate-binding protein 1-like [Dendronephthya gigantea]
MSEPSNNAANQDQRLVDHGVDEDHNYELINMEDVPQHINQYGLEGIEEFFTKKLEDWKDVVINIAITGNSGAGKSSFINAIRGLGNDDEGAAETGPTETTTDPTKYPHPTNSKIKFWDLPGVGTPNYPAETYCEKVGLKNYDTFLILAATRFTENDLKLARIVQTIKKSFFFVRTKIDIDVWNESKKRSFNEKALLKKIKENCVKNLKEFESKEEDVFLISNDEADKWDFARLTQAILDVLPMRQRESLTLAINLLTTRSKGILKRKVEILRCRIWKVATASGAGAVIPVPGLSVALDVALLIKEVNFYKSQLGLPDENSYEFNNMTPEIKEKVRKFCLTSAVQLGNLMAAYTASSAVEEFTRFIPFVGSIIAGGISFSSTYYFLHGCLKEMEETALDILECLNESLVDDVE